MGQRRVYLESRSYTGAPYGDSLPSENDKWAIAAIIPTKKQGNITRQWKPESAIRQIIEASSVIVE